MLKFEIAIFSGIGIAAVHSVLFVFFAARLRRFHPDVFDYLGRPSVLKGRANKVGPVLKFIMLREHRELHDGCLSRLSDTMLAMDLVFLLWLFGYLLILAGQM
jgi:hypothetical protein